MKRNLTFTEFASFMNKVVNSYQRYEHATLMQMGEFLEHDAKNRIGHLQDGGYLFGNWKELSPTTKQDKLAKGFVFNSDYNPLFRTGKLRDSISYTVIPNGLYLGSTDPVMIFQEFGVPAHHLPPRPVIGLTMYKNRLNLENILGQFLLSWLTQLPPIYKMKNYD